MQRLIKSLTCTLILLFSTLCLAEEELDPAEIVNGERLFLETRFAQLFQQHIENGGDVNSSLAYGDPALDGAIRFKGKAPNEEALTEGPFKGQSFSCRSCHMVDELVDVEKYGMRTYSDFARRSPLQAREDGRTVSVRNSPPLVNASIARENFLLHFDGEFTNMDDLVKDTLTGRMYGWLPSEFKQAKQHICNVIRNDDGSGDLASEFGNLSYTEILTGVTSSGEPVDAEFLLPEEFRLDIKNANCSMIFRATAKLIAAYTLDLLFSQDDNGEFNLSPYDQFLIANNLPRSADEYESDLDYSHRLLQLIEDLEDAGEILFVKNNPNTEDGAFEFHDQNFRFGKKHLEGLKVFFNTENSEHASTGNCIACHAAPNFTDFSIHNTGATQIEFDKIHGFGSFADLHIPNAMQRYINADLYFPATNRHPNRKGLFREIPSPHNPHATDLGAWNVLLNFDFPKTQEKLLDIICNTPTTCQSLNHALKLSIATFKTPGLRDLSHSAPYMHNGEFNNLKQVIEFYIQASQLAQKDYIRNADAELIRMNINESDVKPLTAFLKSLNEDYN